MTSTPAFTSSFLPPRIVLTSRPKTFTCPGSQTFLPKHVPAAGRGKTSMIFGFNFFQRKDVVALPQNDVENQQARQDFVNTARNNYEWTNQGCGSASLMKGVPEGEEPAMGWIEAIVPVVLRVAINSAINATDEMQEGFQRRLLSSIVDIVTPLMYKLATGSLSTADTKDTFGKLKNVLDFNLEGDGTTLEELKGLFENIKLDTVGVNDQFLRDDVFGWYRIAGPNPMRLTKFSGPVSDMFPGLTNEILRGIPRFGGDTLEEMAADDRLFFVDYKEFDGVPTGNDIRGNPKPGYVYAPRGLFAVPKNTSPRVSLLPLAIQCGQDDRYPMYTPNDDHTDPVTWLAAKLTIQVADAVVHEAVYHLGRTHLLVGLFICAVNRSMPDSHPIFRLLKNHFYGTAFINDAATFSLINPGGTIDVITAPDISTTVELAAQSVNSESFSFNEWMPHNELASRGVLDADKLHYPYRDDVMALWPIVNEWVGDYIGAYYKNDDDVANDYELAAMCKEVTEHGHLHGFGDNSDGKILTVDYLVKAISMVIFTASCQHAAVNFSQSTMMQFSAAMPLGAYAPAPTTPKPFKDVDEWVTKMLPNIPTANKQLSVAELIGAMRYTTLGEYGKALDFAPDSVDESLRKFHESLGAASKAMLDRNQEERYAGLPPYDYLVPKNIPQSINV